MLKEQEAGKHAADMCRKHGLTQNRRDSHFILEHGEVDRVPKRDVTHVGASDLSFQQGRDLVLSCIARVVRNRSTLGITNRGIGFVL